MHKLAYFLNALLQIAAILVLVMSTGGQSLGELGEEMGKTVELVRRGGEKASVIVPLKGDKPRESVRDRDTPRKVHRLDEDSSIPLD